MMSDDLLYRYVSATSFQTKSYSSDKEALSWFHFLLMKKSLLSDLNIVDNALHPYQLLTNRLFS